MPPVAAIQQSPYLISKFADPIFAIFIGSTAAVLRIRREEADKGVEAKELWPTLQRRFNLVFLAKN